MFAKVFSQIFDSSIAESHTVRHIFMDLLVLADATGVVDMTMHAISRRINVPLEDVRAAIEKLASPDPLSRSEREEGRRIVLIDSHRDWGWQIVNYEHYRKTQDEDARRSYFRDYRKAERDKKRATLFNDVQVGSTVFNKVTQEEGDVEVEEEEQEKKKSATPPATRKPAMLLDADWITGLQRMDAYRGINIPAELQKAQVWCEAKRRKCSRPFFVNWINRACADRAVVASPAIKPQKSRGQCIGEAGQRYALLENYNDWPKRADGSNQTPDEVGDADWKKQLPAL